MGQGVKRLTVYLQTRAIENIGQLLLFTSYHISISYARLDTVKN